MDPTISQDQTAGKEEHDHLNLSVLGKFLTEKSKAHATSQLSVKNPDQATRFSSARPSPSAFRPPPEKLQPGSNLKTRQHKMEHDRGETGSFSSASSPPSEQRRLETTKRERTTVPTKGDRMLNMSPFLPSPPALPLEASYSSGGRITERTEKSRSIQDEMVDPSWSSPDLPMPESGDGHVARRNHIPTTTISALRNLGLYGDGDSDGGDAALARKSQRRLTRRVDIEAEGAARESLKYGGPFYPLRDNPPQSIVLPKSQVSTPTGARASLSELYPPYPYSVEEMQGHGKLAGFAKWKPHTGELERPIVAFFEMTSHVSQENKSSGSESRPSSNRKQAQSQRRGDVPIRRSNAERYQHLHKPRQQTSQDDESSHKVDSAELGIVSMSADETVHRTPNLRDQSQSQAEMRLAVPAALGDGNSNHVDSTASNGMKGSTAEPSLIDLGVEEDVDWLGNCNVHIPSLEPSRPGDSKSHIRTQQHRHIPRAQAADLEDDIVLRNQSLAQEQEIEELKRQNLELQKHLHASATRPRKNTLVVLYRVLREDGSKVCYLNRPFLVRHSSGGHFFKGESPVGDVALFEDWQKREKVAFLVFETFEDPRRSKPTTTGSMPILEPDGDDGNISGTETMIRILLPILLEAIQIVSESDGILKRHHPRSSQRDFFEMDVFAYHFLPRLEAGARYLSPKQRHELRALLDFLQTRFGDVWEKAQTLFNDGLVDVIMARYLFSPEDILVRREENRPITGVIQASFFEASYQGNLVELKGEAISWSFNGNFFKEVIDVSVVLKRPRTSATKIIELRLYPLKYASRGTEELLRRRSETFWSCRYHNYVTYSGPTVTEDIDYFDTRFLVDVTAYLRMHGTEGDPIRTKKNKQDDLGAHIMAAKAPPSRLLFLFPPTIYGFDIMEKKWVNLRVDCISPIRWNKSSFETLELPDETKMPLRALVSNKIAADRATDIVSGKGTGLIVLLHGGPGTGKTLTAESVAEIAEKPLYRVTCGDIGIEPRQVEKYLETVFYLGRIWDCVVLLDEADVFLEQRSLEDLARNALVSVFLRTLEYYSGILVLTSNRVGTFDEAFKSRIQLALHYKNLEQPQHAQIWTNFLKRLRDMDERMDETGVLNAASIKELSDYPMNGRQIRNAITTARQLALYNKEPLNMGHLQHSISVSGEFDKDLIRVKGDVDDDELAKEEGYRAP